MTADLDKIPADVELLLRSSLDESRPRRPTSAMSHLAIRTGLALAVQEKDLAGEAYAPEFAEAGSEDIEVVLKRLKDEEPSSEPKSLVVSGVFFDCHLMYPGWWARSSTKGRLPTGFWTDEAGSKTVRNIRHWLNAGFQDWGPSWRLYDPEKPGPYVYGQIGHGDEANSLPVIVSTKIVRRLRSAMGPLRAISVVATGLLYHSDNATAQLPEALRSAWQKMIEVAGGDTKHFLVVDDVVHGEQDRSKQGKIVLSRRKPDIYSAYMWQCLIRERDRMEGVAGTIPIENTIFVWEHTNLLDSDSIKFNYDSLLGKKRYIEHELGEKLLVLQHSYPVDAIVGDVPADLLIKPALLSTILERTRERLHDVGLEAPDQ